MPHFVQSGEVGVVVFHYGAAGGEQLKQLQRRGFAKIVNILFIRHAEQPKSWSL